MTADPARAKSLFLAASEIADREAREGYLLRECGGDIELRERVEALLRANIAAPIPADQTLTQSSDRPSPVGSIIAGRYKLLEEIGEGGMGSIWVAEQTQPVRRKVALKLIKAGMDSKAVLARFEAERQALAMMDHPNIARVLDGGLTEAGRPFFVMEYVKGVPITEYCDSARLSVADRLELFVQVCSAVQHAHQKGIIHRDIKPSNVLVAPYDDRPVPKVIDFGLAKALHHRLTERTLHTAHETVIGTPIYMSPEQAQLNNLDVDTRTDIFSLGVLLYELLTGTTPVEKARFKEAAWDEIRRIIRDEEPPRPSTRLSSTGTLASLATCRQTEPVKLTQQVRGELDWIVMKALEKDRTRRYETANGLARDVQRYLAGDAVEACPPTLGYRLRKLYRRNRAAILTGAGFAMVLVIATVVSVVFGILATSAKRASERDRKAAIAAQFEAAGQRDKVDKVNQELISKAREARRTRYLTEMFFVQTAWQAGNTPRALDLLKGWAPQADAEDLRDFEYYYWRAQANRDLKTFALPGADPKNQAVNLHVLSEDGRKAAFYSNQTQRLSLVDLDTNRETWGISLPGDAPEHSPHFISNDGGRLITTTSTPPADPSKSREWTYDVQVWDTRLGKVAHAFKPPKDAMTWRASVSRDGELIAWSTRMLGPNSNNHLIVQRTADGAEVMRFPKSDEKLRMVGWEISPDNQRIALVTQVPTEVIQPNQEASLKMVRLDGSLEFELPHRYRMPVFLRFSPDGERLATMGADDRRLVGNVWDLKTRRPGPEIRSPIGFSNYFVVRNMCFDPSGRILAVPIDTQILLLNADPNRGPNSDAVLDQLMGHTAFIAGVAFDASGTRLRSIAINGEAKEWNPAGRGRRPKHAFGSRSWAAEQAIPSPDFSRIAMFPARDKAGQFRFVDLAGRTIGEASLPSGISRSVSFGLNGRTFAFVSVDRDTSQAQFVSVWDAAAGKETFRKDLAGKQWPSVFVSPDSSRVGVLAGDLQTGSRYSIEILDSATGQERLALKLDDDKAVDTLSYTPDGRWIVGLIYGKAGESELGRWDASTGKLRSTFKSEQFSDYGEFAFSRDGERLAVVSGGNFAPAVTIWDWPAILRGDKPSPIATLRGHTTWISSLEFSPDRRRILTRGFREFKLWDAAGGQELLSWETPDVRAGYFSPAGDAIWTGLDENGRLWGWEAPRDEKKP